MALILVICKLLVIGVYGWTLKMILDFKKSDKNVKFEMNFLSRIELSAGIGLALVAVVAVITPTTYYFTLGVCLLSLFIGYYQHQRIILVGDKKVLFKGKSYWIRDVKKLSTGMITLKIHTKQNPNGYSVFNPLTTNKALKNKLQAKIK